MRTSGRSGCPINLTLEVIVDRWSLIVLRDIMFGNRRHFRELLARSDEGIASNVLAGRLKQLLAGGLVTRASDPDHKQKATYSLTEAGIDLVPLIAEMSAWGLRHQPVTSEVAIRARLLAEGGRPLLAAFMEELRYLHLAARKPDRSVLAEFSDAILAFRSSRTDLDSTELHEHG
jgi:DNA-binding HxlR family transcriptional regulator